MPRSFLETGAYGAGGSNTGYNYGTPATGTPQGGGGGSFTFDDSGMSPGSPGGGAGMQPWGSSLAPGQSSQRGNTVYTNRSGSGARGAFGEELGASNWTPQSTGMFGEALNGGTPRNNSSALMFADGGEVPGMDFDPMAGMRSDLMERIALARQAVSGALKYGREQNGLGDLAFNPSQSDSPRPTNDVPIGGGTPAAGQKPFGMRRVPPPRTSQLEQEDGSDEPLGFNPSQSETGAPRPAPGPGTLPAPANPFGRRGIPPARTSEAEPEQDEAPQEMAQGAIPDEDEEAA